METLTATLGDNATISNYDIQGIFDLRNDNITFENCRFTGIPDPSGTRGFPFVIAGGNPQPSIVTFRDCEFAGNGVEQADPDGDLNIGWALATPSNITSQVISAVIFGDSQMASMLELTPATNPVIYTTLRTIGAPAATPITTASSISANQRVLPLLAVTSTLPTV
jgi:hypothetical protein